MDIRYTITFHTYWHCGSGLAAGVDVDLLVVKDRNRLPYVPGKTVKGLLREAVEELALLESGKDDFVASQDFMNVFGLPGDTMSEDAGASDTHKSQSFFSNAELTKQEREEITDSHLQSQMYGSVSQTAIGSDGIAKEHSLRKTEVVIPCRLHGVILNVPGGYKDAMAGAMSFVKQIGLGRNRGLGRCTIEMEDN